MKVIDGPYSIDRSDTIIKDSRQAVKEFIPYYKYIMSENYTMSGWKEDNGVVSKPDKSYDDWKGEFLVGCRVGHKKFGE